MDDRKIFILDDDDYNPGTNIDVKGIGEILDLSSDDDVLSTKIGNVFNRNGPEDVETKNEPLKREAIDLTINDEHAPLNFKKPMKQESIDLTGLDSESESDDDASRSACQNIFTSRNNDNALANSTTAVDVTHLFDFSSANFMPGPAYMEDEVPRSIIPCPTLTPQRPNAASERIKKIMVAEKKTRGGGKLISSS
ncbi:uncharacterized protein BT62DRAFT_327711 [Guyanagaster necrorhizus]|uniref:Uncharacterized protein n=1 Tax=Guyanagaster necrorhizus TaxID=856835 RepID=A0A9P7VMC7_9AGAR|nr:uncharacterized protein BT62DRAFT_327711 [Guyanagaster necrorhizus MCA 3950]KAG7443364.1 hypothetical protein BT62DRAFT_327711 [Guyanagaster necrorhizus MCA 3950]